MTELLAGQGRAEPIGDPASATVSTRRPGSSPEFGRDGPDRNQTDPSMPQIARFLQWATRAKTGQA